jgi:hypothetical protein
MNNGDNGQTYANYLGHANDVALSSNDGNYYMFIITMKAGSTSLVKLKYVGTTYYRVGNYTIRYNGADKSMSGVKSPARMRTTYTSSSKPAEPFTGAHFH